MMMMMMIIIITHHHQSPSLHETEEALGYQRGGSGGGQEGDRGTSGPAAQGHRIKAGATYLNTLLYTIHCA